MNNIFCRGGSRMHHPWQLSGNLCAKDVCRDLVNALGFSMRPKLTGTDSIHTNSQAWRKPVRVNPDLILLYDQVKKEDYSCVRQD